MSDALNDHDVLPLSDERLITAVRDGDKAAYATLYERHSSAARGLARQLVRGETEIDDVVSEAFTKVLSAIQRGSGPRDGFRAYLLTSLRRVGYDRAQGDKRHVAASDMAAFDKGEPFVDPALEGLERSLIARAFLSLPGRWQTVLWHTEIEGAKPGEIATLLGVSANGAAALAYRAREGLREAYLQMHLADGATEQRCRPALGNLGSYVRGGLAKREATAVDRHLDGCGDCRAVYVELMDVNAGLRGIIGPIIAGPALAGYLGSGAGGALGGLVGGWWGRLSVRQQRMTAAGTATTVAAATAVAFALVGSQEPAAPPRDEPVAAAPQPQPQPRNEEPERPQPTDEPQDTGPEPEPVPEAPAAAAVSEAPPEPEQPREPRPVPVRDEPEPDPEAGAVPTPDPEPAPESTGTAEVSVSVAVRSGADVGILGDTEIGIELAGEVTLRPKDRSGATLVPHQSALGTGGGDLP